MEKQLAEQLKGMILIPAGEFMRGSKHSPDEQPIRQVKMSAFAIDRTPVTNKEFRMFMEDGGYENPDFWTSEGWDYLRTSELRQPNYWKDEHFNQEDQPVTGVSWWEALAYARYIGKTLPTEAQWEYACKGTDGRKYPWGNEEPTPDFANYAVDCDPFDLNRSASSVFAHPKNVSFFGCMDMSGNMAEWCLDNASIHYKWDPSGIDPVYITKESEDHIVRGGCGLHNEDFLRCTSRDYYPPTMRDNLVGFRCVINDLEGIKP
ncbi:formylglycine-generating enzyme family protein [Kroppenstedtia pulmonis]|uniref:formylglycine-generating enzyme family protein n=1 Tax=Kroppenstedtia pulmonis TaxID=1380685 RepID=UPI001C26676B|nr:SUMF1/EgtB/PvdO family nonheme iron enzyme [Kroppenstedtia pulmonis]